MQPEIFIILNQTAFSLWGADVSWAEIIGDVAGALCVWLIARQNIWNWPLGLTNNVLWGLLFWNTKLYADSVLQACFFVLGVYGWWTWTSGARGAQESLPVRRTTRREWQWMIGATGLASFVVAALLMSKTDSPVPLWDASILTLGLAATYGQTQKLVESWWLWIVVDVISVPLYVSRKLYPTAILYVVFACICVQGLRSWQSALALRELGET